jgi:RNA-directed DNA polymerase
MEESHWEGPASHPDPESCADGRKAGSEALTGAHTGQPFRCEIKLSRVPTWLVYAEGHIEDGVTGEPTSDPAQLKTLHTRGNSLHWNREIPTSFIADGSMDRSGKGTPRTPDMHDVGKSDGGIVPQKSPNNDRRSAEAMEGRPPTEGNSMQTATSPTQSGIDVTPGLQRVREVAQRDKMRFGILIPMIASPPSTRSKSRMR